MPKLILYHALFSTCSQKVRYTLGVKGLTYESRLMDLGKGEHLEDWYLAINPNGVVPALHDGNINVIDSSVICEYLDEVYSQPRLSPADPCDRAGMRAWMRYFEEVPTSAIRAPSFNTLFVKSIAARSDEDKRRMQEKSPLRKHFYSKMGDNGFPPEVIAESMERLRSCLTRVNASLSQCYPFLLGENMTIADIVLLPTIVRMEDLGLESQWADLPAIRRWYGLMKQNPAFEKAYLPGSRFPQPK